MFVGRSIPYGGYFLPIDRFRPGDAIVRADGAAHGDGWLWFHGPYDERDASAPEAVRDVIAWADRAASQGRWSVGFVTYEAGRAFDAALGARPARANLPLAAFRRYQEPPTFWNELAFARHPDAPTWEPEWDEPTYAKAFEAVRSALAAGETYQTNLTFRLRGCATDSVGLFARWVADDPPPYAMLLGGPNVSIACLSPELFFERRGHELIGRPMKGTARSDTARGSLPESAKERAENLMVVDMIRNDLGRIARTGTVSVPALFTVERHGDLLQMTSTIRAESEADLVGVFEALFPCASIVGAPKVATTRLIAELESSPRGVYTGAVGFVAPGGDARFAVAIRTATFFADGRTAEYGVGSGVVWDSACAAEWEECAIKRSVLERAAVPWELLETMRFDPEDGIALLGRHLARMARSASEFGIAFSEQGTRAWLNARTSPLTDVRRLRLRLGRDGGLSLDVLPPRVPRHELTASWAATPVRSTDRALGHKTTYRAAYSRRLAEVVTDEVLLWNERGEATEFANGNLIVEIGGQRITPPVEAGCLAGTHVADLLEKGELAARPLPCADVEASDRIWFANSVVGEIRVRLVR
ncbi:MAG: chorismate-binding protein [Fimbriimonadaceae bacterium]|nr:chorismate-binding protein [Fimbriimonadaceae bacterium]